METDTKNKIQEMKEAGIDLGAKVEIFLKEGAVWNTGWGDAPTVDPQGYEVPENRSLGENKGISGVGYVAKYDDNTVMLAPTWNKGPVYKAGNYFVHADVIHSFKKL